MSLMESQRRRWATGKGPELLLEKKKHNLKIRGRGVPK